MAEQRLSGGKIRNSTINLTDDYIEIKHFNELKLASEREINSLKADLKAIQDSSKSDLKKITQNEGNFKKIEIDYQKLSQVSKKQALIIAKNKEKFKALEEENQILHEEYMKVKSLMKNGAPSPAQLMRDRTSVFRDPTMKKD